VQIDLADPGELHRTVMSVFPNNLGNRARQMLGVLYRVEIDARGDRIVLLIQSLVPPDFAHLQRKRVRRGRIRRQYLLRLQDDCDAAAYGTHENPVVRAVAEERSRIVAGDRFTFHLRANATTRSTPEICPDGNPQNSKRLPVLGDAALLAWLAEEAAKAGFVVVDVQVKVERPERSAHKKRGLTLNSVSFQGQLVVTNAHVFREAMVVGIGPGKAYGFGLLSIEHAA